MSFVEGVIIGFLSACLFIFFACLGKVLIYDEPKKKRKEEMSELAWDVAVRFYEQNIKERLPDTTRYDDGEVCVTFLDHNHNKACLRFNDNKEIKKKKV